MSRKKPSDPRAVQDASRAKPDETARDAAARAPREAGALNFFRRDYGDDGVVKG